MKEVHKLKWLVGILSSIVAAIWLTGCGEGGGGGGGSGSSSHATTNAPASVAGRSITHTITSGSDPLPATGSYVLQLQGNDGDTSGNYTITGSGGVPDGFGSYTYTMTAANTGTLVLVDQTSNQEVDTNLAFGTPNSGTFSSSSPTGEPRPGTSTSQ